MVSTEHAQQSVQAGKEASPKESPSRRLRRHLRQAFVRTVLITSIGATAIGGYFATQEQHDPGFTKRTLKGAAKELVMKAAEAYRDAPTQGFVIRYGQRVKDGKNPELGDLATVVTQPNETERQQRVKEILDKWEQEDNYIKNTNELRAFAQDLFNRTPATPPPTEAAPTFSTFAELRAYAEQQDIRELYDDENEQRAAVFDLAERHPELKAQLLQGGYEKTKGLILELAYNSSYIQPASPQQKRIDIYEDLYAIHQKYGINFLDVVKLVPSFVTPYFLHSYHLVTGEQLSGNGINNLTVSTAQIDGVFAQLQQFGRKVGFPDQGLHDLFLIATRMVDEEQTIYSKFLTDNGQQLSTVLSFAQKWQMDPKTFREVIMLFRTAVDKRFVDLPAILEHVSVRENLSSRAQADWIRLQYMQTPPETLQKIAAVMQQLPDNESRTLFLNLIVFSNKESDISLVKSAADVDQFLKIYRENLPHFLYYQKVMKNDSKLFWLLDHTPQSTAISRFEKLGQNLRIFQDATEGLPALRADFYQKVFAEMVKRSQEGQLDFFNVKTVVKQFPEFITPIAEGVAIAEVDLTSLSVPSTKTDQRNDFTFPEANNTKGGFLLAPFFIGPQDSPFVYDKRQATQHFKNVQNMTESEFTQFMAANRARDVITLDTQLQPRVMKLGDLGETTQNFFDALNRYAYVWTYNPLLGQDGIPLENRNTAVIESEARWQLVVTEDKSGKSRLFAVLFDRNVALKSQLPKIQDALPQQTKIRQIVQMDLGSLNWLVPEKNRRLSGTQIPGIGSEGVQYYYLAGNFLHLPTGQ